MDKKICADFLRHFGQLLGSGKPLVKSLEVCSKKSYIPDAGFVEKMIEEIKSGKNFSETLSWLGLDDKYLTMLKDACLGGTLDYALIDVADLMDNDLKETGELQVDEGIDADEKQIIQFVNARILEAVEANASDIHIIPSLNDAVIKFRVNGVMRYNGKIGKKLLPLLVARIKTLSCLDVAEKRLPQDGRIRIKINGQEIDIRTSIIPAVTGEKVTMRLLLKTNAVLDLDQIMPDKNQREALKEMMKMPYGLILVTGATGSGKTTTCYSMLKEYVKRDLNVVTAENPVEYVIDGATQVTARNEIGYTPERVIYSLMRSDPDVLFVSEFLGKELIDLAVKAAQTGHMVIGQFHNDSVVSILTMLAEMEGLDHAVMANVLVGIVAQKLVRKLCSCKEKYALSKEDSKKYGVSELYRAVGCEECIHSGYKGRVAVYDAVMVTHEMKQLLATRNASAIGVTVHSSLRKNAEKLVADGTTSIDEVNRVFGI